MTLFGKAKCICLCFRPLTNNCGAKKVVLWRFILVYIFDSPETRVRVKFQAKAKVPADRRVWAGMRF